MKNEILKFLKQDYLNDLDLIYALEHGAKIKYYNQAGIMLKFEDIYMLAFKDEKIAEQLLKQIDKCSMLAIHNDKYFNIINQKWRLNKEIVAYPKELHVFETFDKKSALIIKLDFGLFF